MAGRVLELRVHGVSNTPPGQILGLDPAPGPDQPQPRLVAGDATTGFYRSTKAAPEDPVVVEAYSWGQLTSGARTARDVERALWTVLLPFTLANVALHARPGIPADPDTERWHSRSGIAAWLIRLFCLSLTGTLTLTFAGLGVDLIGWQCVDVACLGRIPGPWEFLAAGWWSHGARALAVGLLVPWPWCAFSAWPPGAPTSTRPRCPPTRTCRTRPGPGPRRRSRSGTEPSPPRERQPSRGRRNHPRPASPTRCRTRRSGAARGSSGAPRCCT
ncbi:hypothetical protein [Micromonospora endolithica]|uniref:hypothetical protein n=1 Tax=Micromonospora endolithica TaxID=230091 RepID=UPI001EDE421D|nr:hypothetical protein [Micromonospora endolithica]